jgi:hypothetical protein
MTRLQDVIFTEDIVKIAGQQGRHAGAPLGVERGLQYLDPERLDGG